MRQFIEDSILPRVTKPTRYQGTELHSVHKTWDSVDVRMVFAFPDIYEVGMSHLGLRILYDLVNNREDTLMERVFAPWTDMEELLRQHRLPLFSLESYRPLQDFDVVAFTLQYEMSFSNILNMLDLAGIPQRAAARGADMPLVLAGGPCAFNPEPLSPFIDAFVIGEGEEVMHRVINTLKDWKSCRAGGKEGLLRRLAAVAGVYVPAYYDVNYNEDQTIREVMPKFSFVPSKVTRQVVKNLDSVEFPVRTIVPFMEVVHDRIMLEVLRGCSRGCRFCQAGMIYRPVREKQPATILRQAEELLKNTGYDEISLTSLSTSDYSCVQDVLQSLMDRYGEAGVGISLPSLRADSFSVELAKQVQRVRRTSLTFAPEAGTQRLRDVINKGVTEENLMAAVEGAFRAGWSAVKLYFMIGLPTETKEDLDGIASLANRVVRLGQELLGNRVGRLKVTVSASSFVPKAHTPFQWVPQIPVDDLLARQKYLAGILKNRRIVFNWHDAKLSFVEAVFARGGRWVGDALERAWQLGCKFDSWTEHFKFDKWLQAFAEAGIDPVFYAGRQFPPAEVLPWDYIDAGVSKRFLRAEYDRALAGQSTGDCRFEKCTVCGVCQNIDVAVDLKGGQKHAPC